MKQELIVQITVLDKETRAPLLPPVETEIKADVANLKGVINHVGYTIQGMININKDKMIGKIKDVEKVS